MRRPGALRSEPLFTSLFAGTLFGINAAFIWIVLFVIGFHYLLHRHRFGKSAFATGGNRAAAKRSASTPTASSWWPSRSPVAWRRWPASWPRPASEACSRGQGAGLELQAIAACVIGGPCCAADEARSSASSSASSSSTRSPTCAAVAARAGFYLDMFIATLIVLAAIFNHLIERRRSCVSVPNLL